jgi:hypothetical protein
LGWAAGALGLLAFFGEATLGEAAVAGILTVVGYGVSLLAGRVRLTLEKRQGGPISERRTAAKRIICCKGRARQKRNDCLILCFLDHLTPNLLAFIETN